MARSATYEQQERETDQKATRPIDSIVHTKPPQVLLCEVIERFIIVTFNLPTVISSAAGAAANADDPAESRNLLSRSRRECLGLSGWQSSGRAGDLPPRTKYSCLRHRTCERRDSGQELVPVIGERTPAPREARTWYACTAIGVNAGCPAPCVLCKGREVERSKPGLASARKQLSLLQISRGGADLSQPL